MTHTSTNDAAADSDTETDSIASLTTTDLVALLDASDETPFTADELEAMDDDQLSHVFTQSLAATVREKLALTEDEADAERGEQAQTTVGADADGGGETAPATNAATTTRSPRDQPATAGTMADWGDHHGVEGGTGDARRANSDRYSRPLAAGTEAMQANADREPSEDASAGTMADYLDRDVDAVTPRRPETNADPEDADATHEATTTTPSEDAAVAIDGLATDAHVLANRDPAPGTQRAYEQAQQDDAAE